MLVYQCPEGRVQIEADSLALTGRRCNRGQRRRESPGYSNRLPTINLLRAGGGCDLRQQQGIRHGYLTKSHAAARKRHLLPSQAIAVLELITLLLGLSRDHWGVYWCVSKMYTRRYGDVHGPCSVVRSAAGEWSLPASRPQVSRQRAWGLSWRRLKWKNRHEKGSSLLGGSGRCSMGFRRRAASNEDI